MISQRTKIVTTGMLAIVVIVVAAVVLWPSNVAMIRCADGSSLVIRAATFGLDHRSTSEPRWHPSLRDSSAMRRGWERLRDHFRERSKRLRRAHSFHWRARSPAIALWGAWNASARQSHTLRFQVVDESGKELAVLTPHMTFGEQDREGIIATTTNVPSTTHLRVKVFDETSGGEPTLLGEFRVRNELP